MPFYTEKAGADFTVEELVFLQNLADLADYDADNVLLDGEGGAGSQTLADTSALSTNTAKSIYQMTSDVDVNFKRSSALPMLYMDESSGYVGIGTTSPQSPLNVVGSLVVQDLDTETRALRIRGNGGGIDVEAAGNDLYMSIWTGADFTGTQTQVYKISTAGLLTFLKGVIFNDNAGDFDFRIKGDTDSATFFVDASTDRIGIGTDTPTAKLDVVGNAVVSGTISVADEAYDTTGWDGDLTVPTKNAVRDALEDLAAVDLFKTIAVGGQDTIEATSPTSEITLVADSGINITTNAALKTVTIKSTVQGGGIRIEPLTSVAGGSHEGDGTRIYTVPYPPTWITVNGQTMIDGDGYALNGLTVTFTENTVLGDKLHGFYNLADVPGGGSGNYIGTLSAITQ